MEGYDVLDIARYVINYCNDKDIHISNLKLQKILYFIQASFYLNKGRECFKENMEAWKYGPVVPEAYFEFRRYGSNNIPYIKSYFTQQENSYFLREVIYSDDIIDDNDKEIIKNIIEECSNHTASELVDITHSQKPWKETYVNGINKIIEKSILKSYFKGVVVNDREEYVG